MLTGTAAFRETGMPQRHARAIQDVADRTLHAIMFRAVGSQSTKLLEEGYAAKGFRIDTKSCDWGPMRGFVCVDPRLSKVGGVADKVVANRAYTTEALHGGVRADALGGLDLDAVGGIHGHMADWMAGTKPVVISLERYIELSGGALIGATDGTGRIRGVSTDSTNVVRFPWMLIPIDQCMMNPTFAAACGTPPIGGYGVFVDHTNEMFPFVQERPEGVTGLRVDGFDAVLGLINPDTAHYGYRALVTGDYDLFGVWPPIPSKDTFRMRNDYDVRIVDQYAAEQPGTTIAHTYQHYKLGNITPRLQLVKVLLNTALIGGSGYPGGNLVHHSDEIGNPSPGLRKSLDESFPILCFLPETASRRVLVHEIGICLTNLADFRTFVGWCLENQIFPVLRDEWVPLVA